MDFNSDEDIPESVVEAFVEKIVVHENSFDWYLRFSGDYDPLRKYSITGRKGKANIEDVSSAIAECSTGCNCE